MAALDEMDKWFEIDLNERRFQMLRMNERFATSPASQWSLAKASLTTVLDAIAREDYRSSQELLELALRASENSKINPGCLSLAKNLLPHVRNCAENWSRIQAGLTRLKSAPNDGIVSGEFGLHLCLLKNDWEHGLRRSDGRVSQAGPADPGRHRNEVVVPEKAG